jgi:xanthine/uracil permease
MKNGSKTGQDKGVAFIIAAIGFLVVGILNLMLVNIPISIGILVGTLVWLLVSLHYLTKEHREMKHIENGKRTIPTNNTPTA